jgi:hypothetical protein
MLCQTPLKNNVGGKMDMKKSLAFPSGVRGVYWWSTTPPVLCRYGTAYRYQNIRPAPPSCPIPPPHSSNSRISPCMRMTNTGTLLSQQKREEFSSSRNQKIRSHCQQKIWLFTNKLFPSQCATPITWCKLGPLICKEQKCSWYYICRSKL